MKISSFRAWFSQKRSKCPRWSNFYVDLTCLVGVPGYCWASQSLFGANSMVGSLWPSQVEKSEIFEFSSLVFSKKRSKCPWRSNFYIDLPCVVGVPGYFRPFHSLFRATSLVGFAACLSAQIFSNFNVFKSSYLAAMKNVRRKTGIQSIEDDEIDKNN